MSDIVAKLDVLSRDTGCLIDISAVVDLGVCSKIDVKSDKPHKVEEKDDYICVTPTEDDRDDEEDDEEDDEDDEKRCGKKTCYEVREEVCDKPTVAMDMQLLPMLGLLTKEDLEKYLKQTGDMGDGEELGGDGSDAKMDPLLSVGVGDDDSVLGLDVAGEDGLLDLTLGGKPLLNLGGNGGLLNLGGNKILRRQADRLLDVDVGGQRDKTPALIDVDVATHSRMFRRQSKSLLDVDVGGEKDENEATIDVDLLTNPKKGDSNTGKGGKGNGSKGSGNNNEVGSGGNKPGKGQNNGGYLTHYQPICKKGFRKNHRKSAEKCHAKDVNHCLAICNSKSALITIGADVKAGDKTAIQLCAAVEFDSSAKDENCHYFVSPETEPCHDEDLEEKENCVSFIRN